MTAWGRVSPAVGLAVLLACGAAWGLEVVVVPTGGDTTEDKLAAVDAVIVAALEEEGYVVHAPAETKAALAKLALPTVESLKEADMLGTKVKGQFVLRAVVTPLAGQDSIEVTAYYLPEGRVELLEEIATEGEIQIVIAGMLKRLVTKEGLAGKKPPGPGEGKEPEEKVEDIDKAIEDVTGKKPEGEGAKPKEEGKSEDDKLVKDLQTWPEDKKTFAYGIDYRIGLELNGGPTVMLTKPVSGGRVGGYAQLSLGYVAVPACGCDFGGEVRAFFGPVDAFSIAAFGGFNFRLSPKAPLYAGGRLTLGYFKNISGARSNKMILRGGLNFNVLLKARYMIIISPLGIELLAFEGKTVVLYDASLGFGVRF
jgi:hypothetical protein